MANIPVDHFINVCFTTHATKRTDYGLPPALMILTLIMMNIIIVVIPMFVGTREVSGGEHAFPQKRLIRRIRGPVLLPCFCVRACGCI